MNTLTYTTLLATSVDLDPTSIVTITVVMAVFIAVNITNLIINHRVRQTTKQVQDVTNIMQHAMEIGSIFVVRFDLAERHVTNIHGLLLPAEGMTLDDYTSHMHPDDRQQFTEFITQLSQQPKAKGESSYRWHANEGDEWQHVRNNAITEGRLAPYYVVSTLTDETDMLEEQQREQDLGERYRLIFEKSVVGLSFYDSKGMMLAANENMRQIFNIHPGRDPFFYAVSIFDRPPFQGLVNRDNLEEMYFCTKITMPERGINSYMEIRFNPIFDDVGQLQNISVAVSDLTEEREMYQSVRRNEQEMREANAAIQQYETELQYLMENCDMRVWRTSFHDREVTFYKGLSEYERKLSFDEFKTHFMDNSEVIARNFDRPELYFDKPVAYLCRMRSLFHAPDSIEWNMLDCMPVYDDKGQIEGCFGTIRNMTALMKTQEQLKEETRRANESAHLKSVFMANMTHEIRTPLNSIVGFSDLLPMIDAPEEKQEMVKVIMNNCDMLLRLINDILEVSDMDANAIAIEPKAVDFALAFDDICHTLEPRIQTPGVTFVKDNPYTTLTVVIDLRRAQQVITNFVTNAVKYTSQGHIKVGYRLTPRPQHPAPDTRGLYVYCEDTGTGIPKDKQAAVFERFVKLNDYVQGTGLGLAISKAIVTRTGGDIGVSSEGEGHGSTFWFWMPCEAQGSHGQES